MHIASRARSWRWFEAARPPVGRTRMPQDGRSQREATMDARGVADELRERTASRGLPERWRLAYRALLELLERGAHWCQVEPDAKMVLPDGERVAQVNVTYKACDTTCDTCGGFGRLLLRSGGEMPCPDCGKGEKPKPARRCDTCRWWETDGSEGLHECHRYPPVMPGDNAPTLQPLTEPLDWCGEWQEREGEA